MPHNRPSKRHRPHNSPPPYRLQEPLPGSPASWHRSHRKRHTHRTRHSHRSRHRHRNRPTRRSARRNRCRLPPHSHRKHHNRRKHHSHHTRHKHRRHHMPHSRPSTRHKPRNIQPPCQSAGLPDCRGWHRSIRPQASHAAQQAEQASHAEQASQAAQQPAAMPGRQSFRIVEAGTIFGVRLLG